MGMTEREFEGKMVELVEHESKRLKYEAMRLYQCGGVDALGHENDCMLPRLILTVALEKRAAIVRCKEADLKVLENLRAVSVPIL